MDIAVCALMYGKYHQLHRRFISKLLPSLPAGTKLHLGANELGPTSISLLSSAFGIPPSEFKGTGWENEKVRLYTQNNTNRRKYPVMREMFDRVPDTSHTLWLDDDTMLSGSTKWWDMLRAYFDSGVDYTGVEYFMRYTGKQLSFIKSRDWYRGKPPVLRGNKPVFVFYTGSFWGLSARARAVLDWPDREIGHNGGDTLLGEAVRQNNLNRKAFPCQRHGIRINSEKRRGLDEAPAGSGG